MEFILSKIISRPARNAHDDNCDMTAIEATSEFDGTHLINNGHCDSVQLSTDIDTVNRVQLIVFGSIARCWFLFCVFIE